MSGVEVAVVLTNLAIGVGLSVVGQALQSALASDPDPAALNLQGPGTLANKRSSQSILPLCYGTNRVGINQVYCKTLGSSNQYLRMIALIGEGEIDGIVREDGTVYQTTNSIMPHDNPPLVYFDDRLWSEWEDICNIRFYNGASDQAVCTRLATDDSDFNQLMRYSAYLYIQLTYSGERWMGLPNITVVNSGLKIYNPITRITETTSNPALIAYDFMTRPSTRGGMGLNTSLIDKHRLSDSIDYCTSAGWTANMPIIEDQYAGDNLSLILSHFRGSVIQSSTQFHVLYKDTRYESTVMALTDADVVDGSITITQSDIGNRPNTIRVKYLSAADNYILKDYVFTDAEALAEDGDYREIEVQLPGLNTMGPVKRMAYYLLERARNQRTVSMIGSRRTIALEAMDLVTLTHDMPMWTDMPMRVVSSNPNFETMTCELQLLEESTWFYNATYEDEIETLFETSLPYPDTIVPSVIIDPSQDVTEEVYNYRGRSYTRLYIDFDPPDNYPWFDYARVYVKIGDGGFVHKTISAGDYMLDPVEEGQTYEIRFQSVNIFGVRQRPFANCYTVKRTIVGRTAVPSNLASMSATVSGDCVSIYADPVNDPDVEYYEVRLGTTFVGGIFIQSNKQPNIRLVGVRPGTHTFWMSPVRLAADGTRIYSATPVSASCTVYRPPWLDTPRYDNWTWDFNGVGTHDNTEHTLYGGTDDALKCSHTNGVLTGTYTSSENDFTESKTVRVWGDFDTVFVNTASTFAGVAGTTATFDDLSASTLSFDEIFGSRAAGQLSATLQYSTDDVNYYDVNRFEILCAEITARYIRIVVSITDPTLDSNLYLKALNMDAYSITQPSES